jgi:peptide/nickel transport system permease protein
MLAAASTGSMYTVAWWMLVFPSAALLSVTLAFNLLGDSVRDALDPRQTLFAKKRRPKKLKKKELA